MRNFGSVRNFGAADTSNESESLAVISPLKASLLMGGVLTVGLYGAGLLGVTVFSGDPLFLFREKTRKRVAEVSRKDPSFRLLPLVFGVFTSAVFYGKIKLKERLKGRK